MENASMAGFFIQRDKGRALLHFSGDRSAISLEENCQKNGRRVHASCRTRGGYQGLREQNCG
jgi:hypothetical protein